MKIIGGSYKGRNFYMPKGIRPTQNIVKKSLFDTLGQDLEDVVFLDLFSGSGSIGLEALSRGAKEVVFVEKESKSIAVIEENLALLASNDENLQSSCEVIQADGFSAIKMLQRRGRRFDFVFIDPPYSRGLAKKALKTLGAYDIVQPTCVVILQHDKHEILPQNQGPFALIKQKKYGSTVLNFYKISQESV